MEVTAIEAKFDLKKLIIRDGDYRQIDSGVLAGMVFQLFLIREFEQTLLKLQGASCIHGPVHTSIGQEACAVGAMAALEPEDKITATHRAHHHYLAKAVSFHIGNGLDPLAKQIPAELLQEVTCLLGEVMGLSIGCCGGRGGSMHLRNSHIGVIGTNAIVAGGVPLATGAAFAVKHQKDRQVVVCFLGDGAVNQGAFHEALNLAGLWKLPVIYFIENNLYAVATPVGSATVAQDLALKAGAYGIRGRIVDGMDPVAVTLAVREARELACQGQGPTVIEAKCYRFLDHAGPLPGSALGYRKKEEEDQWRTKDPLQVFPRILMENHLLANNQTEEISNRAKQILIRAVETCTQLQDGKCLVKENLWPNVESSDLGLKSKGEEFSGVRFSETEDFSEFEDVTYVQAIAGVIGRHLEKDDRVFVLGEEVASFGGGAYAATKGLPGKYPDRVINTPISECGFTGLAGGAAMAGLHPIVEIMFPDFALVAADQLFNQIGKLRHIYGNTTDMPLVVRTRIAIGCGYGGQHSMDPTGLFALFSGWRMVAPSNAFDYIGLFNSAMLSLDPVLIIEHHALYSVKFPVPKNNLDFFVPIGKAKIVSGGNDVTVLCYSSMVQMAKTAADELAKVGVEAEVIDLRTVNIADIDYETIGKSLKRTLVLVILEQASKSNSIGARIAHECENRFFDWLDSPIITLTGKDIPNPVSRKLEAAAIPDLEAVKDIIFQAAKRHL